MCVCGAIRSEYFMPSGQGNGEREGEEEECRAGTHLVIARAEARFIEQLVFLDAR